MVRQTMFRVKRRVRENRWKIKLPAEVRAPVFKGK
jgi:hypothetical protein